MAEFRIQWVDETGSTNADLLAAARQGAEANTVLVADYQSAGRGRRGRTWGAAPGSSLLFSVLMRPRLAAEEAHLVTTALALGAVEACDSLAGVRPGLKWPNDLVVAERKLASSGGAGRVGEQRPNDLVVAERKLAGVLAETVVAGKRLEAVVVGMGLNVRTGAAPLEAVDTAAALEDVCGSEVGRPELLAEILDRFSRWMGGVETPDGQAALMAAARHDSATLGRRVSVELAGGAVVEGVAEDLDERGALLLEGGVRVVVGDAVHLRADC